MIADFFFGHWSLSLRRCRLRGLGIYTFTEGRIAEGKWSPNRGKGPPTHNTVALRQTLADRAPAEDGRRRPRQPRRNSGLARPVQYDMSGFTFIWKHVWECFLGKQKYVSNEEVVITFESD